MHVSSYLEAFLSVYGWMMYNTLYDLLGMTWLIFLPFMKLGITTFIDTIADSGNSYAQFKKGLITFLLMVAALFMALVPLDPIKVQGTTVMHHCRVENSSQNSYQGYKINGTPAKMKESYGFDVTEKGKVPLLPSLVMRIAAGTNNVIYKAMPCAPSVRDFAMVMNTAEVTKSDLRGEVERFNAECATPVRDKLRLIKERTPKTYKKIIEWGRGDMSGKRQESLNSEMKENSYPGSKTFRLIMSGNPGEVAGIIDADEQAAFNEIMLGANPAENPLRSASSVINVESEDQDASKQQQANNTETVKCSDWWGKKLYSALKENAGTIVPERIAQDEYFTSECHDAIKADPEFNKPGGLVYNPVKCKAAIENASQNKEFWDYVIYRMFSNVPGNSGLALQSEDKDSLGTVGVLGLIGAVLGSFVGLGSTVLSSIMDNAASFYASMFFYRVMLQMLQPMLLMGIFCFWGIYLIVADYRWETILKGLILIFIISTLPGLWSISQHLDSALWYALYPDIKDLTTLANKSNESYVERILLDAASTVFNVIFPLILMYLVTEAGSAKATQAYSSGAQGAAEQVARTGGSMTGGAVSGVGRDAKTGIDKLRNWRDRRNANRNLPPGGSKY